MESKELTAQELRLGNWVKWQYGYTSIDGSKGFTDEYYQVTINTFYTEVANSEGRSILKELFPIPLTPELLVKIGFKKYSDTSNMDFKMMRLGKVALEYRKNINRYTLVWFDADDDYGNTIVIFIDYIHQLQNLYFALTGTELVVEL